MYVYRCICLCNTYIYVYIYITGLYKLTPCSCANTLICWPFESKAILHIPLEHISVIPPTVLPRLRQPLRSGVEGASVLL